MSESRAAERRSARITGLRRLLLALSVIASALSIGPLGTPVARAATERCTDWNSYTRPPETIWVEIAERSLPGDPPGTRVQVDFKTYVERVVTLEWGPSEVSRAQLMSAALVVKQYAWWYVMHPSPERRDRNGDCYDIGSTTKYQLYRETASTSKARAALIRAAVEATWSTSVWKTSGYRKGPAHTGYRAGAYADGCQPGVSGFHLFQQNARKCARLGESAEALVRRYYGPNVALFDPRTMTIGGLPVGAVWRVSPDRRLWSADDGAPWVNHGRLLPELGPGELSLSISAIDAPRTSATLPGYELVELRLDANGAAKLVRLHPEAMLLAATVTPASESWELPPGWLGIGDRLLTFGGDFDGDLLPELGLLRLRDDEGRVGAELASIELDGDAWRWRSSIWSVSDLAARGIDPWRLAVAPADVNGDGVADLALLTATSPSDPHVASHPTSLFLASSYGRRWDQKRGEYPDPLLGDPVGIDRFDLPIEQLRLFGIDRNADGRDELAVAGVSPEGALRIDLVSFPSRSALPFCLVVEQGPDRCHRSWLQADPSLGGVDLTTLALEEQLAGVGRDEANRREPEVTLLISASFTLAGERIYAIDPNGERPSEELTPSLNLLPVGSLSLDR